MVKKLVFLVLSFFVFSFTDAQNAYSDAMTLGELNMRFNSSDTTIVMSVASTLAKYLPPSLVDSGNALKTIDHFTAHNPFARAFFQHTDTNHIRIPSDMPLAVGGAFPFADADVTNFADGLAKFLVTRTKEELSVAFLSTLKEDLENKKYVVLQTIFPLTFQQLELIGDKVYQFSIYLNDLRNAFISDINNFPTTLPYVFTLPQYQDYFKAHQWVAGVVQMGIDLGKQLTAKTDNKVSYLSNIINDITADADTYFPIITTNPTITSINGAVKTFGLISSSLTQPFADGAWLGSSDFLRLTNNDDAFKIYLSLLYELTIKNPIVFGGGFTLTNLFDSVAAKATAIQAFKNTLTGLVMQMNIIDQEKAALDTLKPNNAETPAAYYAYFSTGTAILQKGLSFLKNLGDAVHINLASAFLDNVADYAKALQDASSIYTNIQQKKFPAAISSTVDFFTVVLGDMSKTDNNVAKILQRLSTYGTFIAEVATAKSSNEVDSIIAQTVLPTGSSYVKKHSRFNISMQAYTGLYGGQQRQATDTKFVGAAGVYAPVGIGFSWGLPRSNKNKAPGSFTIFASVIDIGPLVSFRFSNYNDSIANSAKVRLSQIVSPGLHLVYGVPKLPISLGLGCNWAPLITNVESTAITADSKNAFRYQAFIAVDIPFFTFYNNPR
jgi:hypothetical protein